MDSKRLKAFLTERGLLDFLPDFEVYCSSPAFLDLPDPASDPDMEVESNPSKEPTKQPAVIRPSEDFDSNPGWRDDSDDYSDFTPVQRRKTSRVKSEVAPFLSQATDGPATLGYFSKKPKRHSVLSKPYRLSRFIAPKRAGRSYTQPSVAPQGAVVEKPDKVAALAAAKILIKGKVSRLISLFLPSLRRVVRSHHLRS
ncbi:hypothetical protein EVAR_84958_1 [Eumeta japonica]|uniref:Uncharacterized protein n=1 Tax=Eumeta variegata TaxID=151549 RepID=A0A4C1VHL9_EUMVA|nr:hypothetical protein EVAR_84958_1 [Eumeta japonica]